MTLLLSLAALGAQDFKSLEDRIEFIRSLGPRLEGSSSEKRLLEAIHSDFLRGGIPVKRKGFSQLERAHSFSGMLAVEFPGTGKDKLSFVIPIDGRRGASPEEGAPGIALAWTAVRSLGKELNQGKKLPLAVEFIFAGAERREREGARAGLGSQVWIQDHSHGESVALVYLSLEGPPERIGLVNAGKRLLSPFWYYERVAGVLGESGFHVDLASNRMQLYRLGFIDRPGPLGPFLEAGIPAVELHSPAGGAWPVAAEAKFSALIEALVQSSSKGFEESWDSNYISFQIGDRSIVIREEVYFASIFGFAAAVVALVIGLSIAGRARAKAMMRSLPLIAVQIVIIYITAAAAVQATGLAYALEARFLGSEEAWRLNPGLAAAIRIAMAFLLFLAGSSCLIGLKILPRSPYFYEAVALFFFGLDVFAFIPIMPPLVFYFVWAFIFAGFSLALRKPWASLAAYSLILAPLSLLALEMANSPEPALFRPIAAPEAAQAYFIAVGALPYFIFLVSPLLFYFPKGRRVRFAIAAACFFLAAFLEEGFILLMRRPTSEAPIRYSEIYDQNAGVMDVLLSSSGRLGTVDLRRGEDGQSVSSPSGEAHLELSVDESFVWLESSSRPFLDRRTWSLVFRFKNPPYVVSVALESDEELTIYDCNYPYLVSLDGRSAAFFIGSSPPSPLRLEITSGERLSARARITAEYLEAFEPARIADGRSLSPGSFIVKAAFPVGGAQ